MSTVGGLDGGWSAAQWVVFMMAGLNGGWSAAQWVVFIVGGDEHSGWS